MKFFLLLVFLTSGLEAMYSDENGYAKEVEKSVITNSIFTASRDLYTAYKDRDDVKFSATLDALESLIEDLKRLDPSFEFCNRFGSKRN
jgi:hypothetical protein